MIRWKNAIAGTLVTATLILALVALGDYGRAKIPPFASDAIGFSEPRDRRAFQLLTGNPTSAEMTAAEVETRAALSVSPYNNAARLRLSYIDAARHGGVLGTVGLEELARSYDLVPLDHTVAAWRVGFALEHWGELTPQVRGNVQAEAMLFGRTNSRDANVRAVLTNIRNPEGRLAAALWLRALHH